MHIIYMANTPNSFLNIITFLLATIFYYMVMKPKLKYEFMLDPVAYKKYMNNDFMYLACYLLLVMIIQFIVNTYAISSMCGGSITENIGKAGVYTFIPWVFLFGVLEVVLMIYPGFKSAFADVVGYFYVSNSANNILTELLIDKDVQQKLDTDPSMTPEKKKSFENAADAIIKIMGNISIIINQIAPTNFNEYWNILKPIMKEQYQTDGPESQSIKSKLFDLVVSRDNVGEAMWFIYAGILLTAIVQLKITTSGCVSSPQTQQANLQQYQQQQEEQNAQTEQATSTTYTITG
jgi:hypothetical protein